MSQTPEQLISYSSYSDFYHHLPPPLTTASQFGDWICFSSACTCYPSVTIISRCWVCWLSPHPLDFWRVSERLHQDFVSLLSLTVRLLFLIIAPLFPLYFSSFQPHFPSNSFDCLPILVCVRVCTCVHFWCVMQSVFTGIPTIWWVSWCGCIQLWLCVCFGIIFLYSYWW